MRLLLLLLQVCIIASFAQSLGISTQISPWNGTWTLNEQRSMKGAKGAAADDYRFTIAPDNSITWEIPSLHEVVKGKVDGHAMEIHRPSLKVPMTLALNFDGPRVIIYHVTRYGKAQGEGRMTLVENGTAWGRHLRPRRSLPGASRNARLRPCQMSAYTWAGMLLSEGHGFSHAEAIPE